MNPSEHIDQLIAGLTDWRGKTLASIRKSILEADREIIEEWKWMGSPVWSRDGIIAVGNAHKDKVKLTYSHGASSPDPDKLFNAGLGGNTWRAIDFFEDDKINERALKNLVRAAVDYNQIKLKKKAPAGTRAKVHKSKRGYSRGQDAMSKTKYAQKIIFFYCYKCKDYELKTSPHYRSQSSALRDGAKPKRQRRKAANEAFIPTDPDGVRLTTTKRRKQQPRCTTIPKENSRSSN